MAVGVKKSISTGKTVKIHMEKSREIRHNDSKETLPWRRILEDNAYESEETDIYRLYVK